jgi:serine/threonine protein kinase
MPRDLMLSIVGHGNVNENRPAVVVRSAAAAAAAAGPSFTRYYERRADGALHRVERLEDVTFVLPNGQRFHEYVATHPERTGIAAGEGGYGKVKIVKIGATDYILKHMFWRHSDPTDAENEADNLVQVDGSPFVMRIEAAIVLASNAYFLSPYIPGQTLDKWLIAHTSREDRMRVYNQLLQGIEFIHDKNLVHRDVKPENIWVPDDDARPAFFLDFGISTPIGEVNIYRGTRKYIPEHLEGRGPQRVEQNYYALGVIFGEAPPPGAALNVDLKKPGLRNANARGHRFVGGLRFPPRRFPTRISTRRHKKRALRNKTRGKRRSL